jgi:hypothetical protein
MIAMGGSIPANASLFLLSSGKIGGTLIRLARLSPGLSRRRRFWVGVFFSLENKVDRTEGDHIPFDQAAGLYFVPVHIGATGRVKVGEVKVTVSTIYPGLSAGCEGIFDDEVVVTGAAQPNDGLIEPIRQAGPHDV